MLQNPKTLPRTIEEMKRTRSSLVPVVLGALLAATLIGCASPHPSRPSSTVPSGWPLERSKAVVTAGFGASRGGSRHQGIDLAAPKGTPVRATADGRVIVAEKEKRYGRTVVIDHGNGFRTRYAHLKAIETRRGKTVRRGDLIGRVGSSGNASGPHLHYEVIRNGAPVDPGAYLE